MSAFDPVAATAAYMTTISPEAHAKATAYTQGGHWLILWGWLIGLLVSFVILKSGLLSRVSHGLQKTRHRPFAVGLLCALIFLTLSWLLNLPWTLYTDWWREKAYGLNNQTWSAWLFEAGVVSLFQTVITGVFTAFIYVLLRRAPRTWVIWSGVVTALFALFFFAIAPVTIQPMLNKYTPAPAGPVREMIVQMGHEVGVPTDKILIFNGSKQSSRYTANVAGLFGTARVAMSDTMFSKGADLGAVRGVVGHEMGHYVHQHSLWFAAFITVFTMGVAWLTQLIFPLFRRLMGARDVEGIADPAGLPVLMAAFATVMLIATPIMNTVGRTVESDADAFSLSHFHEPDGMARALMKTVEYRASSPSALEEIIFYDHPSVEHRVRNAMTWKAAHLKEAADAAALEARVAAETPGSAPVAPAR